MDTIYTREIVWIAALLDTSQKEQIVFNAPMIAKSAELLNLTVQNVKDFISWLMFQEQELAN